MEIDLTKVSGAKKNAWWYSPKTGALDYIGEFDNKTTTFQHDSGYMSGNDQVLILTDASKDYINKDWKTIPTAN